MALQKQQPLIPNVEVRRTNGCRRIEGRRAFWELERTAAGKRMKIVAITTEFRDKGYIGARSATFLSSCFPQHRVEIGELMRKDASLDGDIFLAKLELLLAQDETMSGWMKYAESSFSDIDPLASVIHRNIRTMKPDEFPSKASAR